MAINFKKIAQENTVQCKIMLGRTKLDTDEVVGKTCTVVGFDFAPKFDKDGAPVVDETTGEVDKFGVIILAEFPDRYYNVGTVFSKVCKAWAAEYNGDAEAASKDLAEQGGVAVKFVRGKTKAGNQLINVVIL